MRKAAIPRTQVQKKILEQIETQGYYTTTSERNANAAHRLSGQGVQHIYSSPLDEIPGRTIHRFAKRQHCR